MIRVKMYAELIGNNEKRRIKSRLDNNLRKQRDRLEAALPEILDGYCVKSDKPRDVAEKEAMAFLTIIEDSSSYMFGYNHSIAYCLLGYLCAFYRHYHPLEFITSFLNNAANEDDIRNGTLYANKVGIRITMPKWGLSKGEYFFDKERNIIARGLTSIKYMNESVAEELYELAQNGHFNDFIDVLYALNDTSINSRQLDILIKIDFFSEFGNQRELLRIVEIFSDMFKSGSAKQIRRERVEGTPLETIIRQYATSTTKSGAPAASYRLNNVPAILHEAEKAVLAAGLSDLDVGVKVRNFAEVMGYAGYTSGKEEDRRKLYIEDVYPLVRKKDKKKFGYSVITRSIGSGVESRFTVFNRTYVSAPIHKGDIIRIGAWERDGKYFVMHGYTIIDKHKEK